MQGIIRHHVAILDYIKQTFTTRSVPSPVAESRQSGQHQLLSGAQRPEHTLDLEKVLIIPLQLDLAILQKFYDFA